MFFFIPSFNRPIISISGPWKVTCSIILKLTEQNRIELMTRSAVTSQPNLKNTIKCVWLAIYFHIKNRKSNVIFDEKSHPLMVSNKPILSYYIYNNIIRVTLNTELETLWLIAFNSHTSHLNMTKGSSPESWTPCQENRAQRSIIFSKPHFMTIWIWVTTLTSGSIRVQRHPFQISECLLYVTSL